ncbi:MAG TPA: LacI family DNA-binding transcriptional regulator [Thermomicrobiales bacterium]|jgi:LacI family transcriptional regulator|nr:LacI family DNA-binding transcriptional regulator [Thermomicrobiales bacterium]
MAQRRVTIDDIAREAQASPTTVSLVLRDKPGISSETRQRVLAVARSLGYQHRRQVRPSSTTEPINVGLVVRANERDGEAGLPPINPFYSWVVAGIESAARAGSINLLYASLTVDAANRHLHLPMHLLQQELDGVLLVGAFRPDTVEAITVSRSCPIVMVDGRSGVPGMDAITTDNVGGAMVAVRHVFARGHRQIAFLGPAEGTNPNFDERREGYRAVLSEYGLEPVELAVEGDRVEDAIDELTDGRTGVTALFAANDRFALSAIAAIERRGLRVPTDFSVMGFDNIEVRNGAEQILTTMAVDKTSLGRLAVETLRYRIAWPDASEITLSLRPRLVKRTSVGSGPESDRVLTGVIQEASSVAAGQ